MASLEYDKLFKQGEQLPDLTELLYGVFRSKVGMSHASECNGG
jgi:hypothetical protein